MLHHVCSPKAVTSSTAHCAKLGMQVVTARVGSVESAAPVLGLRPAVGQQHWFHQSLPEPNFLQSPVRQAGGQLA